MCWGFKPRASYFCSDHTELPPQALVTIPSTVDTTVVKLITVSSPLNLLLVLVFQKILLLESFQAQTEPGAKSFRGQSSAKKNACQNAILPKEDWASEQRFAVALELTHTQGLGSYPCNSYGASGVNPDSPSSWKETNVHFKDLNLLFCPRYKITDAHRRPNSSALTVH